MHRNRTSTALAALVCFFGLAGMVACSLQPDDSQIRRSVDVQIQNDKVILGDVKVEAHNHGYVTLSGQVSSEAASQAAFRDAKTVPGVKAVFNHLTVDVHATSKPQRKASPNDPPVQQVAGEQQPQVSPSKNERYREITAADGIKFEFHGAAFYIPVSGGPVSGPFVEFGVDDSLGNFITQQGANTRVANNIVDGHIFTRAIGDILVSADASQKLTYSATESQIKNLRALLSKQPNAVVGDNINEAVQKGNLERVRAMLKRNPALVSRTDIVGYTPLHWAAANSNKDIGELLLENGASVTAKNPDGDTPLCTAVIYGNGNQDVAELLIAKGADVNAQCSAGTPLHLARPNSALAVFLREHGAH